MGHDPKVWIRCIRQDGHTYHGRGLAFGDVYLACEEDVENICDGLKWGIRDVPPERAARPIESVIAPPSGLPAKPGTGAAPSDPAMAPWPTPSSTTIAPPQPPAPKPPAPAKAPKVGTPRKPR